METIGVLESDEIIDHVSIFIKIVYSINGCYLPFDDFVGKKVRIIIEEV